MVAWLVRSGIRLGKLGVAAAIAVLALGVPLVAGVPVEAYPNFTPTTVEVQTEALGLSATEVESLVTVPLEQDLLNGVPWVDRITSRSIPGLSAIDLVFVPGTDEAAARQLVQERMTQVRALPNVGTPPVMMQPLASTGRVSMVALSPSPGSSVSLIDLSVLARWKIKPRLMGVPGVANVAIYGQRDRQLQVQADPVRMAARQVSLSDVTTTAANAMWVSPLSFVQANTPGTGGFVESPNQRLAVQHILPISSAADLATVPLAGPHPGIRLGDVATVVADHQPLIGDAVTAGASSLVLVVERFPSASTEEVTRGVEQALDAMRPGLAGVSIDTGVYRPATYLETATRNIGLVGAAGLVLLVAVVLVLTWSWRRTVVIVGVLLVALVGAAVVLALTGTTFTAMTLVGLAAALAVLVDDVVTDVDAISRRLPRSSDQSRARRVAAVAKASVSSRRLLLASVLVVPVLAAPVLFLVPFQTAFSAPVVLSYLVAVAVSTLVALLVTPSVSLLVLGGGMRRTPPVMGRLVSGYRRLLAVALRLPSATVAATIVLAAAGMLLVPALQSASALPTLHDPNLLVHLRSMPGTSLPEMDRVTSAVSRELGALPGVVDVGTHVGRAVMSDQAVDVNSSELWVTLAPDADYVTTRGAVEAVARGYPGLATSVSTYTADQLDNARQTGRADLVVRVFGNDLSTLQTTARQVQAAVRMVPGVTAASVSAQQQEPAAQVVVDLQASAKYGLRPGDVRRQATTMMSGLLVGNLYENQAVFDVVVQGPTATTQSLTSLGDMPIDVPSGGQVPLRQVATVHLGPEPTVIRHEGVSRATDVAVSVAGGGRDVQTGVEAAVRSVTMPTEFHAEVSVPPGSPLAPDRRWPLLAVAATMLALLLLQAATGSWRLGVGLLLSLGLVAVGGLLGASLAGSTTVLGVLVGVLAGLGLAARQGVALVRTVRDGAAGSEPRTVIVNGAGRRAGPVLLSAMATASVLLPALLVGDRPGLELLRPFAAAALGSLLAAVVAVLVVVPVLCLVGGVAPRGPAAPPLPTSSSSAPGTGRQRRWRRS